jgi:hypothetical protein
VDFHFEVELDDDDGGGKRDDLRLTMDRQSLIEPLYRSGSSDGKGRCRPQAAIAYEYRRIQYSEYLCSTA